MRIAILGRTRMLLNAARILAGAGHEIGLVWTCGADEYYSGSPDEFEQLAIEFGALFRRRLPKSEEEFVDVVQRLGLELGVSVNWTTLMTPGMIGAFPKRILNAHAGDLPRYRGNAVVNWAMLSGETKVGMCIHEMAHDLDAGPVYQRDFYPLDNETYLSDVYEWLDKRTPEMFVESVAKIAEGSVIPTPQDADIRTLRCYPRKPEDAKIAWSESTVDVSRLVRASSRPLKGAFSFLDGKRVTVWRAEPMDNGEDFFAVPGQVCFSVDGDPVIATGDGMMRLTEIEVEELSQEASKRLILKSFRNRLTS